MHVQKKEYPTLKQLEAESEFQGSVNSLRRQLKSIGFTSKTSTDERTFLMDRSHFCAKKMATLDIYN
jgi:hypothetical protein